MFLGPRSKVGKKMHFGAFWSKSGLGMDNTSFGQEDGRIRSPNGVGNMFQGWRNKFKSLKIRNQLKRRRIIQNIIQTTLSYLILSNPYHILTNLILSYPCLNLIPGTLGISFPIWRLKTWFLEALSLPTKVPHLIPCFSRNQPQNNLSRRPYPLSYKSGAPNLSRTSRNLIIPFPLGF